MHEHNPKGKKMVSETIFLELELQAIVSHSNLMLGIEPNSSARTQSTLNCWVIPPVPIFFLFYLCVCARMHAPVCVGALCVSYEGQKRMLDSLELEL